MQPGLPALDRFIAYAMHRTKVPDIVIYASLLLLQRLKARFPGAKSSSGHRPFTTALVLASKVLCDDTYSNKSWCVSAQGLFSLSEINSMEREMCTLLDWELNVDNTVLDDFVICVEHLFSSPGPVTVCHIPLNLGTEVDSSMESSAYGPGQIQASDPRIESPLQFCDHYMSASLPPTPGGSRSPSGSPTSTSVPRTPPNGAPLPQATKSGTNTQACLSWHSKSITEYEQSLSLQDSAHGSTTEYARNRANAILWAPGSKRVVPSPTMRSRLQVGRDMYAYPVSTCW